MATQRDKLIEGLFEDFASFRRVMMSRPERHETVLPRVQMEVLFMVDQRGDMSISELARCMRVTGSAATQVVEALVQQGSLARTTDEQDRRVTHISLTAHGREQIGEAKRRMGAHLRGLMESLSEQDLASLRGLLQKIIAGQSPKA